MERLKTEIKNAEILCVGTELLLGDIINTNAAFLSKELAAMGISIYHQSVVGDNEERLFVALQEALSHADLVITTGGLGPTTDDLTKETASKVFGRKMFTDDFCLGEIKKYFEKIGKTMPVNNEKQALIPEDAVIFTNAWGTAPGVALEGKKGEKFEGKTLILLPGPPEEMSNMFTYRVVPYIKSRCPYTMVSRNLHLIGIGESAAETLLRELMDESANPTLAPYAKYSEVRLRITAKAKNEKDGYAMCDEMIEKVKKNGIAKFIFGIDVDSMEKAVIKSLAKDKQTLAVAESCTGGLISKRLTDVPGASEVFIGSAITYANEAKVKMIGVNPETIEKYGAVSKETASEMAKGVRATMGTDFGISVTGIAGPDGGTPEKPVGTVYIGIDSKYGNYTKLLTLSPMRDREFIRNVSATQALALVLYAKNEIG